MGRRYSWPMVPFSFAGEDMALLEGGALYWAREQALLVADLHAPQVGLDWDAVVRAANAERPDLVLIGGISQKNIECIREVIRQLRAGLPEVEILLATGTFGTADPRDAAVLAKARATAASLRLAWKVHLLIE